MSWTKLITLLLTLFLSHTSAYPRESPIIRPTALNSINSSFPIRHHARDNTKNECTHGNAGAVYICSGSSWTQERSAGSCKYVPKGDPYHCKSLPSSTIPKHTWDIQFGPDTTGFCFLFKEPGCLPRFLIGSGISCPGETVNLKDTTKRMSFMCYPDMDGDREGFAKWSAYARTGIRAE